MSISRLSKTALRPVIGLHSPARPSLIAVGVRGVDNRQIESKLPAGSRAFWSYIRGFAKSLYESPLKAGQVPIANPDNDPRYSKEMKPLAIEVVSEPLEIEKSTTAWITCSETYLKLQIFTKGYIKVYLRPISEVWAVRWIPNKRSSTFEEDQARMPKKRHIATARSLELALRAGDLFAQEHYPHQFEHLSVDAIWFSQPGTERGLNYLFRLSGVEKEGQLRSKELLVHGERIPVHDLTKGKVSALITVAKYNRRAAAAREKKKRIEADLETSHQPPSG